MTLKDFVNLLALLCAIPTGYLAFRTRFIDNIKVQYVELLQDQSKAYNKHIRLDQRVLAALLWGIKGEYGWLNIFNSMSEVSKKINYDRSDAVRGLIWFSCSIAFAIIALLLG